MDTALFLEFAQGRVQQVAIVAVAAAAGKRPLSRPGVPFAFRAPHQQNRIRRPARVYHRDCRVSVRHFR
jgi:hypothetical protein